MAFDVLYKKRSGGRRKTRPMSDINVTPFVDVMLVLLIIFMVTAPLLTVGVEVDLPKTRASVLQGEDEPLAVSIDAEGQVYIQDTKVDPDNLIPRLNAITGRNPLVRIFMRADRTVSYGQVMTVMSKINRAGYGKVALLTKSDSTAKKASKKRKNKGGQ